MWTDANVPVGVAVIDVQGEAAGAGQAGVLVSPPATEKCGRDTEFGGDR